MPDLDFFLEWNNDHVLTPNADLQLVSGWDRVKQQAIRLILTIALGTDVFGNPIPPEYFYHEEFGLSARLKVGSNMTAQDLYDIQQAVAEGMLTMPEIAHDPAPIVNIRQYPNHVTVLLVKVFLTNGEQNTIALQLT